MFNFFKSLNVLSLLFLCGPGLSAIGVENQCNAHFPRVTQERSENLMSMGNNLIEASKDLDRNRCVAIMYMIKAEVENMMCAQVKLDKFIDDAFWQAEQKGARFTQKQKDDCKNGLCIIRKSNFPEYDVELQVNGDIVNIMNHHRLEQNFYTAHKTEIGAAIVVAGTLIAMIPFPGCAQAGQGIGWCGIGIMLDASLEALGRRG